MRPACSLRLEGALLMAAYLIIAIAFFWPENGERKL
jgi:Ca2+/H+ antiporter